MLVPPETSSAVLVLISSKSVCICSGAVTLVAFGHYNRPCYLLTYLLTCNLLVNSSRYRAFWTGYANLMSSYGRLIEPRGWNLHCWNLSLMLKISYTGCLGLSPVISMQFTLQMCVAASNCKKITKNPISGVQGHRCWYNRKACQQCLLW